MKVTLKAMMTLLSFWLSLPAMAAAEKTEIDFSSPNISFEKVGRGIAEVSKGVFLSKDSYGLFGDPALCDYEFSFRARSCDASEPVQIWSGFRGASHHDRYMLGLRGGLQDDVILMRLGYLGTEEFLGQRPLRFHPESGEWYEVKVQVCGPRIRVFIGENEIPYLDIEDKNASLIRSGGVILGGGWVETEFDDLKITPLPSDALAGVGKSEFRHVVSDEMRSTTRKEKREAYSPVRVVSLPEGRARLSLDGEWLFLPDYETSSEAAAIAPDTDDSGWHVMDVPSFWNPSRIWLHGETMPAANGAESKGVSDRYFLSETDRCENYSFDYRKIKHAWYRQVLILPDDIKGKNLTLDFDAVSRVAEVFVNGCKAGSHIGMFGDFSVDATPYLRPGRNVIVVKVTGKTDDCDVEGNEAIDFFYSSVRESEQENGKVVLKDDMFAKSDNLIRDLPHGFWNDQPAGIWQPVHLTITDPLRVDEVFIKPSLNGASIDLSIANNGKAIKNLSIFTDIIDNASGGIIYTDRNAENLMAAGGQKLDVSYVISDLSPKLWTPSEPNLYDFRFRVVDEKGKEVDCLTETSGFRTFEVKDGHFYLNGQRYWLRGANHTPFALEPNSREAADVFMKLLNEANIEVTRTHNTPWNELWIDAADRNGLGISFEGTWSWLFIHSTPIPDPRLLSIWAEEFLSLLKKYRNHPSILLWTVNNEMKFYDNDDDIERAKEKMRIISDVVRKMREIDPTRPVCFDSNYQAKGKDEKFGKEFMDSIDDGDIDDMHAYYNWYDYSMFRFFNGEFSARYKMSDRPLVSQEFSTGYINGETGHPVRSYQMIHENPLQLIGYDCYDFADPKKFLKVQSFITGELVEATRRSNPEASGMLHFGLLTWFRQPYDHSRISPWPTYYALKRGSQPVLVSAELWGRNLYSGDRLTTRIYVVNDRIEGTALAPSIVRWSLVDHSGKSLASGSAEFPEVPYYGRAFVEPEIIIPSIGGKGTLRLVLSLSENDRVISENEYELLVADKDFITPRDLPEINIIDNNGFTSQLDFIGANYAVLTDIADIIRKGERGVNIISGDMEISESELSLLRDFQKKGGRLLILNAPKVSMKLYPEHITGLVDTWDMADIAFMERDDYPVFNGIEPLELRYFNNGKRELPRVCREVFHVNRNPNLTELAGHMRVHGYCDFINPSQHQERVSEFRGFPLIEIKDGEGSSIVSGLCLEKVSTDPVAGQLLVNMLNVSYKNL